MVARYLLSMEPVFADITFYHKYAIIIRFSTDAVQFFLFTIRHLHNLDLQWFIIIDHKIACHFYNLLGFRLLIDVNKHVLLQLTFIQH